MKKTIRKLVVRRETIRGIRTLEGIEFARVGGGDTADLNVDDTARNCTAADVFIVAGTPARR